MLCEHRTKARQEADTALSGLKRLQNYTIAPATIAAPCVAQQGRARLLDFGGDGPVAVFVPSLINPATILDITPKRSLLRWLSRHIVHPYLIDWGEVTPADANLSVGDHVTQLLLPLLKTLNKPVHLIGYCLGGTMALAAAQLYPCASLTLIAAPWRFAQYPAAAQHAMSEMWRSASAGAAQLDMLPLEVLQTLFWQLDSDGTMKKYADFARMTQGTADFELFVAMEQWSNSGAALPYAAARELCEDFVALDVLGSDSWRVGGQTISPRHVGCPTLEIVSLNDKIVPSATATMATHFRRRDICRGHVGMITGSQARTQVWEPLREWLLFGHQT